MISSPVGMNAELFHGTPYASLARDEREWREAIRRYYDARSTLPALGALGREMVISDFSVDVWAPRLLALLASPSPREVDGAPAARSSVTC